MALIEDIRVNGQKSVSTITVPTISGLHPVIGWDFSEDEAAFTQFRYSLRIGTTTVDLGTGDFSGDIVVVDSILSSSNFYEHKLHNLLRGNTYYGQIIIEDPDADVTPWTTFALKTNNLPTVTSFALSPVMPTVSDDLEISYTYNDTDGHDEAGTKIRWFKNNLHVSEYDDLCILPSIATSAEESWNATIIPSDGLEFGAIAETGAVTIAAAESSFDTITILPTDANVDDILKVEFTLADTEYISLTGIVAFQWFVNDVPVYGAIEQYARLDVNPGDAVTIALSLIQSDGNILAEAASVNKIIKNVDWHISSLSVNDLISSIRITDLTPTLEWRVQKTTAEINDLPLFFRVLVTKTRSIDGAIFDTGEIAYTKNSFTIPENTLSRGQNYFVHVGTSDVIPIPDDSYVRKEINIIGSSWDANVDNATGWTIETKFLLEGELTDPFGGNVPEGIEPRASVYIHDGTYFCAITFEKKKVIFHSDKTVSVDFPSDVTNLADSKTFRIAGMGNDVKIYMNNILLLDATGKFTNPSKLKFIEYGDLDGKYTTSIVFRFFRFTTIGSFGLGKALPNENVFHFHEAGKLTGGVIDYVQSNIISWLPDNPDESARLIKFNENTAELTLPTVAKNFSPITSIHIDKDRNKYIGTSNGVNALYGEKHDPDYKLSTSAANVVITTEDFDRITTVAAEKIAAVEPDLKAGWLTLDTSFRAIGETDTDDKFFVGEDPYNPYIFGKFSHAIHYYSQRTHGHSWYDNVDNAKGWQIGFSFQLEHLEQDDLQNQNIDHKGFGFFINDGTYQEILYIYEDRIRLFYANVYVPLVTTTERNYRIVCKDKNIFIYQKLDIPSITAYQLLVNGTGLFTTPASAAGNSRKPRITFDSSGVYHSVWHDDGNGRSQIFYSSFNGVDWSNPEIIASSKFSLSNPAIATDGGGRVWVAYEDTSWGQTEISVSVRDDIGWNVPTRVTNIKSTKSNPAIVVDSFENVHIVWEDDRNGPSQILWAQREKKIEAWVSSGQFGEDTVIMQQQSQNDPYFADGPVQIKNPQLAFDFPRVWLVAEILRETDHKSSIYRGFRDVENEFWQSMGVPRFNSDGEFIGDAASFISSPSDRNCVKPTIAINSAKGAIVIAWEDQTEPISQIWGSSYNNFGTELHAPIQITSRVVDCKTPAAGFLTNQCAILFESNSQIFLANYDSNAGTFNGSATGVADEVIQTRANRQVANPAIPNFVPATNVKIAYDFLREKDATLESIEFPDYYLVADASISHIEHPSDIIATSTISEGIISNIDTTELAFGDMSENTSMVAHWKDIEIYYGYDSKPLSIGKFNSSTVFNWGDNRINDIFVDTFGNLIVAKFDGLFYHNVFTGELTSISLIENDGDIPDKIVTTVKWGGNGAWFVGTTKAIWISKSAGKKWNKFSIPDVAAGDTITVHDIDIDPNGNAVCATNLGIIIAHQDGLTVEKLLIAVNLPQIIDLTDEVRTVAVDESNVIWTGGNLGLIRIENKNSFIFFNRKSGMQASYVTDIAIVNRHLRYIATASGINRMNGTIFSGIGTRTHSLLNNNIAKISWNADTQSLWVASFHSVHEIVFRDPAHETIKDEVVQYDSSELLTNSSFDTRSYIVLDTNELQESSNDLEISSESASVLINKNPIDFGFSVGDLGKSVSFLADILPDDEVEVLVSNKFIEIHNFNQTSIEKKTIGDKRTSVTKIVKTFTANQTLLVTGEDKHQILLASEVEALPFTTVLMDRDVPLGCIEQIDTLTPTTLKFKIIAFDPLSGIDGYILSNYENFTSDGETPQDFSTLPVDGVVTHNIGSELNNVTTSLVFPNTAILPSSEEVSIGSGAKLSRWTDTDTNTTFLYATTNSPVIVWRYDPRTEAWLAIARPDGDVNRFVTDMKEVHNVLYIATGTTTGAGRGTVYKTTNGTSFSNAASTPRSRSFNAIAGSVDGTVFFGDGAGAIFRHRDNVTTEFIIGIGNTIHGLDVWKNTLIASTGSKGRIYMINLETGDNFIIFVGNEENINTIHIKDALIADTADEARIYAGSGDLTVIYRSDLSSLDFVKSFSSVDKEISRIRTINNFVLLTPGTDSEINRTGQEIITKAVASVGDSLFKHNDPGWEFFYRHDEDILDLYEYGPPGSEGIYVISDSRINKWTSQLTEKTIYLQLRDKAGNVSPSPNTTTPCPPEGDADDTQCCNFAYSLKIADLKRFINESRIVDITEYGDIVSTFDSPNDRSFYSADEIDQEIGIYTSEILNGSNDLVSWKTITWEPVEPAGTSVDLQVRNGVTTSDLENATWTADLVKGPDGKVSLEHISDQYIQFRALLKSETRDLSPTLTSVTLRNLTTQASHFFTTNFVLPSRPVKGLLTANTFIPVTADVVFGINTKNSTDFGDYQIIEPNRLFTTVQGQFGNDFRIGIKLLSPGIPQLTATNNPGDPYDSSSFICTINLIYENTDSTAKDFHFRAQFYNDTFRTQLIHTFFSGNDQTGWSHGSGEAIFPSAGVNIASGSSRTISFEPTDRIEANQRWYIIIDSWDGSFFETVIDDKSYICSACKITNETKLVSKYYKTGLPTLTLIPKFSSFTPDYTLLENNLTFPETSGEWETTQGKKLSGYTDNFAVRFQGKIQAPVAGVYTFELQSSDGSQLFIDATSIIANDGEHIFTTKTGTIELTEGFHDIEVQYFEATSTAGLELRWILPGETVTEIVPPQRFFHAVANEYCDDTDSPKVFNFAVLFELENGETVKLNLTT